MKLKEIKTGDKIYCCNAQKLEDLSKENNKLDGFKYKVELVGKRAFIVTIL